MRTPEGQFVETVIAAQGQLERLQNRRQTLQKIKARVERGYYVFACPVGYRYEKCGSHGRMLVKHEPLASIVKDAIEGYASGQFDIQAEVKRWLEAQPDFPKVQGGIVLNQTVTNLLTRSVYAGMVEAPKWGVNPRKGHHEALITFETFQRIQDRLNGKTRAPARKDISHDFPLRGFVTCGHCTTPLTACWAKGRHGHYPYYFCPKRGCEAYGKSVRREVLEGQFEALLKRLQPTEKLFCLARTMFENLWNHRLESAVEKAKMLRAELKKTQRGVDQFLDRIADAQLPSVITAYENRIRKLEAQRIVLQEKIAHCGRPLKCFDDSFRTALDFLGNPMKLWISPRLEGKRTVLKLAVAERLAYTRSEGFRTAVPALPFKVLADMKSGNSKMARAIVIGEIVSPSAVEAQELAIEIVYARG